MENQQHTCASARTSHTAKHTHGTSEHTHADHTHSPAHHDHHHSHSHGHHHGSHDHNHAAGASTTRLAWALAITGTVLIAELLGAAFTGSLALAADAGHMAVDSSGLIIALIAAHLARTPRNDRYTWGLARIEILAAALQAGMLLAICGFVAWESVEHLLTPQDLNAAPMLWIGVLGLVANAISLGILAGGRGESLNMRAAFLEVANDALGSVAVIIAAILALTTGWVSGDAIVSLLIAALMIPRALSLLRQAVRVLLERVPVGLDTADMRTHMEALPGVVAVHDLHVTTISTGMHALTAHVATEVLSDDERGVLLHRLEECAADHFPLPIGHTTFQIEPAGHMDHERMSH